MIKSQNHKERKKRYIQKNTYLLLLYIFLATLVLIMSNWNTVVYILVSIIMAALCIVLLKLDIAHPYVWYVPIFIVYQISFPTLKLLNVQLSVDEMLNLKYALYNWIALSSLVIFLSNIKKIEYDTKIIKTKTNFRIATFAYFTIIAISIIGAIYILSKGYSSKYDLKKTNSIIITITHMCISAVVIFSVFLCLDSSASKIKKIFFFVTGLIVMLIGMGVLGERDFVFKYLAVFLMYYFIIYKPSKIKMIIFLLGIIVLISISSSIKMFLVRDVAIATKEDSIIASFLNSDFKSAGFTTNFLLNHKNEWKYRFGRTLLYDLCSPINDFINFPSSYMSTQWYQNTFWSQRKTGMGFSIIGEGYLNFGLIGIVIWMFIISLIIRIIYNRSNRSIFCFMQYIYICPLLMYASRADLANVISPFVKYMIICLLPIYLISKNKNKVGEK